MEGGEIPVELTVLGSGSAGNAALLVQAGTRVLLDAGFSCGEIVDRLGAIGVDPTSLDAILLTHAHGDHSRGVRLLSKRYSLPVFMTDAARAEWFDADRVPRLQPLGPGSWLRIGDFRILPFPVPHDAAGTVGFRIETRDGAIGYVTDVGTIEQPLIDAFEGCQVLVIESNHAVDLLRNSRYPPDLRERIGGRNGHLSNEALAAFVRDHMSDSVRVLVLAHLSEENNEPGRAERTCRQALAARGRPVTEAVNKPRDGPGTESPGVRVLVASQMTGAPTVVLRAPA